MFSMGFKSTDTGSVAFIPFFLSFSPCFHHLIYFERIPPRHSYSIGFVSYKVA